jgi:hypothetical protein
MGSLVSIVQVVSEKKRFETFFPTLDPIGKCSNVFFSETANMIKAKLYKNVHWMVLYKLYVFCSDMKFRMVANSNLVKDLPMIIHGQFGFNCPSGFREEAF